MKCFNHLTRDATGICKACGKGLCMECVSDLGYGIACKDKHEKEVNDLRELARHSVNAYKASPKSLLIIPLFFIIMGLVTLMFSFSLTVGTVEMLFFIVISIVLITFGMVLWLRVKAAFKR
ncbi:hypothetical protein MNBD_GAMMA12-1598 [hydrothermal vent metagenome]|uniref:B box-type domain-containing protein n=1 Tax=hydrothermal vent metagenome TaxID=652676 RepID=A0A3B0YYY5_9ZZZZ